MLRCLTFRCSSKSCGEQLQSEAEVERAVAEANLFALASHQFWGTWAFFQAAFSAIDFDYLAYADLRWGEYRKRKAHFLKPFK